MHYAYFDSPLGRLLITVDASGLRGIAFPATGPAPPQVVGREDAQATALVMQQLAEYFAGRRRRFELPLNPRTTAFQARVLEQLRIIPFGQTISYAELAARIGQPNAARAVGHACGRNPLPIVIPCHRVVGSKGALTGFAGGLDAKRWLLTHESAG